MQRFQCLACLESRVRSSLQPRPSFEDTSVSEPEVARLYAAPYPLLPSEMGTRRNDPRRSAAAKRQSGFECDIVHRDTCSSIAPLCWLPWAHASGSGASMNSRGALASTPLAMTDERSNHGALSICLRFIELGRRIPDALQCGLEPCQTAGRGAGATRYDSASPDLPGRRQCRGPSRRPGRQRRLRDLLARCAGSRQVPAAQSERCRYSVRHFEVHPRQSVGAPEGRGSHV